MTSLQKVLAVICLAMVAIVSWLPSVNSKAEQVAEQGLKRTLATFAIVRTVSSTVAVLSSTNVAILKVGEALHPINKLVDQFLDVMLVASASFALQIILLKIGGHWAIAALLSISLAFIGYLLFQPRQPKLAIVNSIVVLLILIRFAIPVTIFGTQAVYKYAIADREAIALNTVQSVRAVNVLDGEEFQAEDTSFVDKIKSKWDIRGKVSHFVDRIKNASGNFVDLIASYVLQSIILPLAFLYGFWLLARSSVTSIFAGASQRTPRSTAI